MTDDYLELIEYDDEPCTMYVHNKQHILTVCHETNGAVRYRGIWTISHRLNGALASTVIPADEVTHFVTITPPTEETINGVDE